MFRNSLLGLLIAAALSLCLSFDARGQAPQWDHVFYVNPAASNAWPGGNGDTWDDAFTDLVEAIAEAPGMVDPSDVIRINVAAGTYQGQPFVIDDSWIHLNQVHLGGFAIPDNMLIYGGYAGVASDPDARDPTVWMTTLTGLLAPGSTIPEECGSTAAGDCFEDNWPVPGCDDIDCCVPMCLKIPDCCRTAWDSLCAEQAVFTCDGEPSGPYEARVDSVVATVGSGVNRRLDGLTITGGGQRPTPHVGSGKAAGGGVYITSREMQANVGLDIVRCVIVDNWAADGGGIALVGDWSTENPHCDGEGPDAGARIWNSEIVDNRAVNWGGGVFARYQAPYEIVNTVIARNGHTSLDGLPSPLAVGGALADFTSAIPNVARRIVNCTITRNFGNSPGIAINAGNQHNCGCEGTEEEEILCSTWAELMVINTIIRNNLHSDSAGNLAECVDGPPANCDPDAPGPISLVRSNVLLPAVVSTTWHDCIDVDPGFVEIDHDPSGSIYADYRLLPSSAMIDAGTPAGDEPDQILADLLDVDDDGVIGVNLDLDLEIRILPGLSTGCPRVDIGAYEFATADNCLTGDLNDDCKVDGADLGILLQAWSSSPLTFPRDCCPEPENPLGGGESMSSESTGLTAAELADLLGFASVAAMVDWLVEQPFGAMVVYLSLLG